MLNTYIQNKGQMQTILHNKRREQVNEIKWDATYDGEEANISVSSNTDGAKQDYEFRLDNQDLETMLNIPSVDMPLHARLQKDFTDSAFRYEPTIYQIELPRRKPAYDMPIEKIVKSTFSSRLRNTSMSTVLSSHFISKGSIQMWRQL